MIFFVAFSLLYIIFLLWARYMWNRIPEAPKAVVENHATFSVIIPVRNESNNIEQLLQDINMQGYPQDRFEVVVVDDHSDDGTFALAKDFLEGTTLQYRMISLTEFGVKGKKNAITEAVRSSTMQYILTVDGDCRVGTGWIAAYNKCYQQNELVMITGPVKMESNDFFTRLQACEFSGLIMIGASSLQSGNPGMCNGANLSYQREAFSAVGGYLGNENVPSGDDEFLLQKIFRAFGDRAAFLKNEDAIVSTCAKQSFGALLNQRIRWSSKWKFHKSVYIKTLALLIFLSYVALFAGLVDSVVNQNFVVFSGMMFIRWIALWYFSIPVTQFLGIRRVLGVTLVIEIIYPFFVTFLGIASIFGKYTWKGRYYS